VHEIPPKLISESKYKIPAANLQSESGFGVKREAVQTIGLHRKKFS